MTSQVHEFSHAAMKNIIEHALAKGYKFYTISEFIEANCPSTGAFILKHDLDFRPSTLWPILDLEEDLNVRSTVYVRVTANDYNALCYTVLPHLIKAEHRGFEIGLHTNFLEFAKINNLDPVEVLDMECGALVSFLDIRGMSTHRDLNYMHNALPWLEERWEAIRDQLGLNYHAYESRLMKNTIYVNEGYSPHLCWRNMTPIEAIATGKSVYMLTHSHWWWKDHPFELY